MTVISVISSDGATLFTRATVKGGGIARAATERQLREFAITQTAAELREDDYYDSAWELLSDNL